MKRDIQTLIDQAHNLNSCQLERKKKKKLQRASITYNWKRIYGTG
jgi:hypothetical protein